MSASERIRRENAYAWHMRWGFPNYPSMIAKVKATDGIDITVEDVKLLPWGENKRLDRGAYQKLQAKRALSSRSIRDDVKKKERDSIARRKKEREVDEEFQKLMRAAAEDEQRRKEESEQHEREKAAKARRKKEADERKKEKERKQLAARRQKEEIEKRKREKEELLRLEAERRLRKEEEERELAKLREKERELKAAEEKKRQDEAKRKAKKEKERLKREEEEKERKKAAKSAKRRKSTGLKLSREPPPPTNGQSPVERAYRCFLVLGKPNKRTLKACSDRCDGLLLVEGDLDTLPWNKHRADLDYAKLRKLLFVEETRRTKYDLAKQLWEKEGRPEKDDLKDKILKLSGGDIRPEDLDALIWDKHECVLVEPDEDNMVAVRKVENEIARRKKEEEERQKLYSEYELKLRSNRPPPVTTGNEPVERAYRWYQRLNGVKKRTLYNVILETPGIDISKADVNLLPWVGRGPRLDFQKLSAMLDEIEERRRKKLLNRNNSPDDEPARRKQALDWYTTLKNPTKETMYRLVDETIGMKMSKADVDLLPWNADGTEVDETSPLLPRRRKSYKL